MPTLFKRKAQVLFRFLKKPLNNMSWIMTLRNNAGKTSKKSILYDAEYNTGVKSIL